MVNQILILTRGMRHMTQNNRTCNLFVYLWTLPAWGTSSLVPVWPKMHRYEMLLFHSQFCKHTQLNGLRQNNRLNNFQTYYMWSSISKLYLWRLQTKLPWIQLLVRCRPSFIIEKRSPKRTHFFSFLPHMKLWQL